ncbi:Rab GTPase [Tieghemostelium lacteum]|uniref:Rab GTPase n=1 Tax=Tieghemostelium lacteum TaxID=361077 RepID=A0A151Z5F6_TIELA|nr:Rab GTPase [Tieghemostelium lacteum]|eukprot:KYQ89200.1 Rab GTPase [Tieghemostelium lacteum]
MSNSTENYFKFVLCGDCAVGKSSFIHRLVFNKYNDTYKQTIGSDFLSKKFYHNDKVINVQLWDTAGKENNWCLTEVFWSTADSLILVYDASVANTFKSLDFWYKQFKDKCSKSDLPVLVLANKSELADKQVRLEDAKKWCQENNITLLFEVSAAESLNIKESILALVEKTIEYKNEKSFNEGDDYDDSNQIYINKNQLNNHFLEKSFKNETVHTNPPIFSCFSNVFNCFK